MQVSVANKEWMINILKYLTEHTFSEDKMKAKKLKTQVSRCTIIVGELYRMGLSTCLLKCLNKEQAEYVKKEFHEGICEMHFGGCTMATQVLLVDYYWPTFEIRLCRVFKKFLSCYKHNLIHQPTDELSRIDSPWPFVICGMNILGPCPIAKG